MEVGCSVFRGRLLPRVRNHCEKKVCYGKYGRANATNALNDFLHFVDCRSSDDHLCILYVEMDLNHARGIVGFL